MAMERSDDEENTSSKYPRFPTAFGMQAADAIPQSYNSVLVTHSRVECWLVTQTPSAVINLIVGIWAMIFCQHGTLHSSMLSSYFAVLVPRVVCSRMDDEHVCGSSYLLQHAYDEVDLNQAADGCNWASGKRGCVWFSQKHSPRCQGRAVDWTRYVLLVTEWYEAHRGDTEAIIQAMSPMYQTHNLVDPEAVPLAPGEPTPTPGSHVPGAHNPQVIKREGSALWEAVVCGFFYRVFTRKIDINTIIRKNLLCDYVYLICDGPSKSGLVFTLNNVHNFNEVTQCETKAASVASIARNFALVQGVPLQTTSNRVSGEEQEEKELSTHTWPEDVSPDGDANGIDGGVSSAERMSDDAGDTGGSGHNNTGPNINKNQNQKNGNNTANDGFPHVSFADGTKINDAAQQPDEPLQASDSWTLGKDAEDDEDSLQNCQKYADSLLGSASRSDQFADARKVATHLTVIPPHMLDLAAIQSPYSAVPMLMTTQETAKLQDRGIDPHTIGTISSADPICVRFRINVRPHDQVGFVPRSDGGHHAAHLPRVIRYMTESGTPEYLRVVPAEESRGNDMHSLVRVPTINEASKNRFLIHSCYRMC
jgi:hypothetical protein